MIVRGITDCTMTTRGLGGTGLLSGLLVRIYNITFSLARRLVEFDLY